MCVCVFRNGIKTSPREKQKDENKLWGKLEFFIEFIIHTEKDGEEKWEQSSKESCLLNLISTSPSFFRRKAEKRF